MKHADEHIANRVVRLDGEELRSCSFQTCTLEIGGSAGIVLDGCTFTDCRWALAGAAATTIAIVARLYAGMIPDGDTLVGHSVASIRQGSGFGTPYKPVP